MQTHSIAVIPGDGVGLEVMPEGRRVLDLIAERYQAEFRCTEFDWSTEHYFRNGRMMPPDGVEQLRPFDAILLGAVGHPDREASAAHHMSSEDRVILSKGTP